jgi:voltage-gated potassium channel Kch
MAILPFMLELILGNAVDLRFLRIIRMVRLLKLGRYSSATDTMFLVIKKEAPVLLASSFMMFLLVFIMAAFGYLLERGAQPDKFENIPTALYWAVITLASVGYGDISPITAGGRLMTVILALVGIGIFAIPAAILASGFTDQLRLNREQLNLDLVAEVDLAHFDTAAREEFIAQAKLKHLSAGEITGLLELIEKGEAIGGSANEAHESLIHAAKNPAFALAQYRTLLSKMQELAALADHGYINAELNSPGKASELERQVWQRLSQGSGSASEPIDK